MSQRDFINDPRHQEFFDEDDWVDESVLEDDPFARWTDITSRHSQQFELEPCERTGLSLEPVHVEYHPDAFGRQVPALRFRWVPTLPASSARILALVCDNNWNISLAFDSTVPRNEHSGYVVLESMDLGMKPEWVITEGEEELHVIYCVLQPGHQAIVDRVDFLNYTDDYEYDVDDLLRLLSVCWMQNGADVFVYHLTIEEAMEVAKAYGWQ